MKSEAVTKSAVRSALNSVAIKLLEEHVQSCVKPSVEAGDIRALQEFLEAVKKLVREVIGSAVGLLASLFASSYCIAPTLFVIFGVSAGSLSGLSVLEPYRLHFLTLGYISVTYSFYRLHKKKKS